MDELWREVLAGGGTGSDNDGRFLWVGVYRDSEARPPTASSCSSIEAYTEGPGVADKTAHARRPCSSARSRERVQLLLGLHFGAASLQHVQGVLPGFAAGLPRRSGVQGEAAHALGFSLSYR